MNLQVANYLCTIKNVQYDNIIIIIIIYNLYTMEEITVTMQEEW